MSSTSSRGGTSAKALTPKARRMASAKHTVTLSDGTVIEPGVASHSRRTREGPSGIIATVHKDMDAAAALTRVFPGGPTPMPDKGKPPKGGKDVVELVGRTLAELPEGPRSQIADVEEPETILDWQSTDDLTFSSGTSYAELVADGYEAALNLAEKRLREANPPQYVVVQIGPDVVIFEDIEDKSHSELDAFLVMLDDFTQQNPGKPVSAYARRLLAGEHSRAAEAISHVLSAAALEMPAKAPALWAQDKQPGDTPVTFFQRVYEPWLNQISKADVRRWDQGLYQAMATWVRRHPEDDPKLPTLKERNDAWVARIEAEGGPNFGDLSAREASRLAGARHRRRKGRED